MASALTAPTVKYVAAARKSDNVIVASFTESEEPGVNFDERVSAILERGKWASVKKQLTIKVRGA